MRRVPLVVLLAFSCGRHGFDPVPDAELAHVQVAPGWTVRRLIDLTGLVPYRPDDYQDGSNQTLDNAPTAVASLYDPFTGTLAVAAGRSIIEVGSDGSATVHDYRPAVPDTTGPDNLRALVFGAPPDIGPALWIGAASQTKGDGVFDISPAWEIARDALYNNVRGIAYDAAGDFDAIGTPTIYFIDDSHVNRRISAGSDVQLAGVSTTISTMAVSATALFLSDDTVPAALDREFTATHARQIITTSTAFTVLEGGPLDTTTATAIRDKAVLAQYANDGTSQDLASSTDPTWVWVAGSAPQPPHPLAGGFIVLESNRTLDRDQLLYLAPGS